MAEFTTEEIADIKIKIQNRLNEEERLSNFKNIIRNKNITICLGNTRSGKSTLVNYLIGNRLRSTRRAGLIGQYKLVPSEDGEGPEVGHGSASTTDFPTTYTTSHNNVLIDSPGFEDNRGIPQDIFNGLCVNQIRFANTIKFVLVCDIQDLLMDNVRNFTNLLAQMSHLVTNIENIQRSVCIIFTKDQVDYTREGLRTIMINNILNQNGLNVDSRLLRNITANDELIGLFKMPTREGDVNMNELDVNINGAIDACQRVLIENLQIRFFLADNSNVFLLGVYPEYTDTQYFESEFDRLIENYKNYFDIDLYVYASYEEELKEVKRVLSGLIGSLIMESRREIINMDSVKISLENLLGSRALGLSRRFKSSFQFILSLDNALLFEEDSRRKVLRNYIKSVEFLLEKVERLSTKINDELTVWRNNFILKLFTGTAFAAGSVPTAVGILKLVQAYLGTTISGSGLLATSTCVVGGGVACVAAGAGYMIYRELQKRWKTRSDQGR